jgi:hypothetical protein
MLTGTNQPCHFLCSRLYFTKCPIGCSSFFEFMVMGTSHLCIYSCTSSDNCIILNLKAIAGEAGVPFFYRAGSEFEEM